jgi:hypothetical protein
MLDTQRTRDYLFTYDPLNGHLTIRYYHDGEQRNIETTLYATAVDGMLQLLSRNVEAVDYHSQAGHIVRRIAQ